MVGSGRVGRTQLLSFEDKARLAARAHIRHCYTKYEDELTDLPFEAWDEDDLYREIKGARTKPSTISSTNTGSSNNHYTARTSTKSSDRSRRYTAPGG